MIALAPFFDWHDAPVIVTPETFTKWHRIAFQWLLAAQVEPPHSARFIAVGEALLAQLAAQFLQGKRLTNPS
jgi:hypothetical protein